jgi:hypothetical protein
VTVRVLYIALHFSVEHPRRTGASILYDDCFMPMSRRIESSPTAILCISLLGVLLLGTCSVMGAPEGDWHRDGWPEVSALADLPPRLIVLPDVIMPFPIVLCKEPCVPGKGQVPAGDGLPSNAYVRSPGARAPPLMFSSGIDLRHSDG